MECMNLKLWGGLTTAAFLMTTLGAVPGNASQPGEADSIPQSGVFHGENPPVQSARAASLTDSVSSEETSTGKFASADSAIAAASDLIEVQKVGEYQSEETDAADADIVAIYPHQVGDRYAATLQLRSIPIFTFLGSMASAEAVNSQAAGYLVASTDVKLPTPTQTNEASTAVANSSPVSSPSLPVDMTDPVQRASAIATRINQIYQEGINAETISVRWDADHENYVIQIDGQDLVVMDRDTILPDTTRNPAEDALQATNRLRRLLGGAAPLRDIEGQPESPRIMQSSILNAIRGIASWYGPGFHGNRSASGERFDQHALTAAHRTLPFGTQVRVTNLNNGLSVVVRINDRGPFSRGRVIDLSAAAARAIGMMGSGVAPVNVEVLGRVN